MSCLILFMLNCGGGPMKLILSLTLLWGPSELPAGLRTPGSCLLEEAPLFERWILPNLKILRGVRNVA